MIKGALKDLVKRLDAAWINKGRTVTTDNYFTSVELAEDLLGVRTTLIGTIRKTKLLMKTRIKRNKE